MVSVTAVLGALTVDGPPAQSYIESSSSSSSSSSLGRRDASSLLYVWLCRLSRNLLRALTGQKGMNSAPLTEQAAPPAVCPSLLSQTPGLMSRWSLCVLPRSGVFSTPRTSDKSSAYRRPVLVSCFLFLGLDLVCLPQGEHLEYFHAKENK